MNIGFDAKRFFHNNTGLGNYSRTLVNGLLKFYPEHQYFLFNPKASKTYTAPPVNNVHEVLPDAFLHKKFSAFWRTFGMVNDLKKNRIDLYHGLSHELPAGIKNSGVKSVVTIHDLIFERYPAQYKKADVLIYRQKFKYACKQADRVIAISFQTKKDLVELYGVNADKIDVCYQSCHPAFLKKITAEEKEGLRTLLALPSHFFLYVGSIIERKNLLQICKTMLAVKGGAKLPLVVIGNGKSYKQKVEQFLHHNNLQSKVFFLSDNGEYRRLLTAPENMAAVYQMATALIYPSLYEGFGIPVLEAMNSNIPVITSNTSCMPETGGPAALYVSPYNVEELATAMQQVCDDESLRNELVEKGRKQAALFSLYNCTASVMEVYKKVME